ncbi:tRNA (adenosine(37)-N6)-dimethylallyltransferase MiaA [Candidatus Berkiella aquae]|uniref:tRNA dimethylallyltransferase n=1 Tax=Candidatus Berkiella aquae TaxID=295108 RepID=A0A0Q9YUF8_9GAMM|nr:tRNA (adenosine(37)-N6)-dimethylallyltransferase MiaA [Candidatus Berkiella aquae]MCS5710172.1 tRNA (adenosine(37)-N6)-dimethylallyltransferase MiaA [Candidatus Berkiella aquae]
MLKQLPILCIIGPTASGKTDASLALAEHLPIEIINVDSAQIYQMMDIGSGKPSKEILAKIPHHLMNILDPAQAYSAGQFCHDAIKAIHEIQSRDRIPVLVGGTMLYFKVLQEGLSELPGSSPSIRAQLDKAMQDNGLESLYQRLQQVDPERALQIKPTDPQRIQRALEIYELTGKTMSQWLLTPRTTLHDYTFVNLGILPMTTPREVLHRRITQRFENMLSAGLVEEVNVLFQRGDLDINLPALRAVGYRQVWQYLAGHLNEQEMKEQAIAATRQLAKRQLTWLRSWPNLTSIDFLDPEILTKIEKHIVI